MNIPFHTMAGTIDLVNLRPQDLTARAIADALSKINRFNGRTAVPWSVAAHATGAEKQEVVGLINERKRLEDVKGAINDIGNTGKQAFKGLLSGALSFNDALSTVLGKLADMAASSAWDMLWGGGKGGGGGLGGLIAGILSPLAGAAKKADGGRIVGQGGPREDNIPIWVSNGENIINAPASEQYQPILDAMNAGATPRQIMAMMAGSGALKFSDGGLIGALAPSSWRNAGIGSDATGRSSQAGSGGQASGSVGVRVYFEKGDWKAEVKKISGDVSAEMVQGGLEEWSRSALPDRIAEVNAKPWMRG